MYFITLFRNNQERKGVFSLSSNAETLRTEIMSQLVGNISNDALQTVKSAIDSVISSYEITRKEVGLIIYNGVPKEVKEYIISKSIENLSEGTIKLYRLRLTDFFEMVQKPVNEIKPTDIRNYLAYYKVKKASSDSYLDNIRRILNSFFTWLFNNEYIERNPCATVDKIKFQQPIREPLTAYELEMYRWNCRNVREKALVDFLFSTGVRVSECSNVKLSDIDWEKRSVIIRHGKGNKQRIVFFNAESELSLRKYLETRKDEADILFATSRNPIRHLGVKRIQDIIKDIGQRADMRVYPHKLRHTFATSGLHGGMPLEKLQSLMGHSKPETTLIYAKLDFTDIRREHQRIFA